MQFSRVGSAHRILRGAGKMVGIAHPITVLRLVGIAHPTLFVLLLAGCASSSGKVTMKCVEGRSVFAQSFNHAYISSEHAGEYDVVLMQDSQTKAESNPSMMAFFKSWMPTGKDAKNAPLQPMSGALYDERAYKLVR